MKKTDLTLGMFLIWNHPGSLFSFPYTTEVKVLELNVECPFRGNALGFSILRIRDGAILPIAYERLDQFSPLTEAAILELQGEIADMVSDTELETKLAEVRRQHDELKSNLALV